MHTQRLTEANILGYQLDRVVRYGNATPHFEVRGPETGTALASFRDRQSAEQFIVMLELGSIPGRTDTTAY